MFLKKFNVQIRSMKLIYAGAVWSLIFFCKLNRPRESFFSDHGVNCNKDPSESVLVAVCVNSSPNHFLCLFRSASGLCINRRGLKQNVFLSSTSSQRKQIILFWPKNRCVARYPPVKIITRPILPIHDLLAFPRFRRTNTCDVIDSQIVPINVETHVHHDSSSSPV
jgi:hypothetical protein